MASLKCLIYERDDQGHRLHHVRLLTDALLEVGCDVVLALQSDTRDHDEYRVHLAPIESNFELHAQLSPVQDRGFKAASRRVDEILGMIDRVRPDWVYIPFADVVTQAAAVRCLIRGRRQFRGVPIEGQVMRGRYAYPATSLRDRLSASMSRFLTQRSPWLVTHLLDPLVYENLNGTAKFTEFRMIPDPLGPLPEMDRFEARCVLNIPTDGRYVAMAGVMEPYKGVDLLLPAFARAKLHADDRLLLVGKMAQPVRELISREYGELLNSGRLVLVDRYVSDFEIAAAFLAGDVLVSPQPRHLGSSGTLVRAAAANRPIIASDFSWIGWATREFEIGTAIDVSDTATFTEAIESALKSSGDWRQSVPAARFAEYHTAHNQKAHWLVSLGRERGIDLGNFATRLDWSSVRRPLTRD